MISLLGLYRPRRTPMHLTPAWAKMLFLLGITISCMVISDPVTSIGITAACLLLLASTKPPLKATLKGMLAITVVAILTAGFQIWLGDYVRALDLAGDLIAISALALAITSSTSMEAMMDLVVTLAKPLRWILPPETLGLMVALALRAIPEAARILVEARVAARARGMDRNLRAILIPSASRTVGFALQLGQALHARGIAEHGRTKRIEREVAESDIRHDALAARGLAEPPVREASGEIEVRQQDDAVVAEDADAAVAAPEPTDEPEPVTDAAPEPEASDDPAEPEVAEDPADSTGTSFEDIVGLPSRRQRRRGLR
ncbi:CbiQ family ECF transporter T component [Demequina sp. SYSU T00039]|uniref:CbiQ family ECF transporter T component n=1 Tax=Demequina lignilytica TaxID=3051663 RepID=A0AAW7M2V6_9MICO|nr:MULTISPECIES: CbiQ family ECF transporter T component [unclassified Demequina]MDN4479077.1 CbiQ family ECF transporter T component [Demequina sp. SYSU T00039-1]MDN4489004.1 CbiQ family ECF transporter T component [Demequina sp. SYSU T00039]MDN4491285.1 CbiQ family ECF transporter T component [Demequina sp. SYSU T00068]